MGTFFQDKCMESSQNSLDAVDVLVSQDYKKSVLNLINDERDYIRDLHMIIKIFREEIAKLDENELERLFSNIKDIYEITVTLLASLEDVVEIEEEKQIPTIGSCFEELAETAEFDIYIKYIKDINNPVNKKVLTNLLSRPESNVILRVAGYSIKEAVKYYLPKLLLQPIRHCFLYFDYIQVLHKYTPRAEDRETLERVQDLLKPLQMELMQYKASLPKKDTSLFTQSRAVRRQAAIHKIIELQETVDGWDQLDIGQCCDELIREDTLKKVDGRKLIERKAILFDGLLILCIQSSNKRVTVAANNSAIGGNRYPQTHQELRLKERFFIRKVDIIDKEDTKELKNAFEIALKNQPNVLLVAKSVKDKNNWMADLVMLNTKCMLERFLNNILLENEERKYPLRLPPVHLYKFAEQDSKDNIVIEARNKDSVPLIKGATLIKLIERLTYHAYTDLVFVRAFLITYRSFCSPQELLTLLIERFDIPDPSTVYGEEDKLSWKRYKREFCQPVQLRILNVLRHWVNHHFYDFERDKNLLERLQLFLSSSRSMRKWVDSLLKIVQRKYESSEQRPITHIFEQSFPPIETHLTIPENNEEYGILTIHPMEFARQLTLLEFELFRKIKPSELVGCVWTKEDKERTSPNLMKMIKHTTNFTRWLEKIIVEAQNFEERIVIVSRAIEIMMVLEDLNNFNGALAIFSAMDSASVYRLKFTFNSLQSGLLSALEEARELTYHHFRNYQEKLRSINPPCVLFLGMYLTNILRFEEGNSDYLPGNSKLINFSKLQKVAEIIGTIQQYQNQPYCLLVESKIRQYIENICPFDSNMSDKDINTYLYNKSLEIEPKGIGEPIEFPRKWPEISLKSPGIRVSRSLNRNLLHRSLLRIGGICAVHESAPPRVVLPVDDYNLFGQNVQHDLLGKKYFIGVPTSLSCSRGKSSSSNPVQQAGSLVSNAISSRVYSAVPASTQPSVSTNVGSSDFNELLNKISSTIHTMRCQLYDIEIEYDKLESSVQRSDNSVEITLDQFKKTVDQLQPDVNDILLLFREKFFNLEK